MKHIRAIFFLCITCLFLSACGSTVQTPDTRSSGYRTITDMAGRTVQIPERIDSIYATGQPGVVMLYTTAPDQLMGWCLPLQESEADFIEPQYLSLPVLGLMQGSNNSANREEILRRAPNVLLTIEVIDDTTIAEVDRLQELLGIPIVMGDIALAQLPDCYRMVGELTGETDRAETLATYCETTIAEAETIRNSIAPNDQKSVYYCQGSTGLQTAPKGTPHSEIIDLVGGENIINLPGNSGGRVNVNMEEILSADPEVIILSYSVGHTDTRGQEMFKLMTQGQAGWNNVKAVRNDNVYPTPCLPYNWLDIPPSANRMIGISWLGHLLYPEQYDFDLREKVEEFYQLFYRMELTDDQYQLLLS